MESFESSRVRIWTSLKLEKYRRDGGGGNRTPTRFPISSVFPNPFERERNFLFFERFGFLSLRSPIFVRFLFRKKRNMPNIRFDRCWRREKEKVFFDFPLFSVSKNVTPFLQGAEGEGERRKDLAFAWRKQLINLGKSHFFSPSLYKIFSHFFSLPGPTRFSRRKRFNKNDLKIVVSGS